MKSIVRPLGASVVALTLLVGGSAMAQAYTYQPYKLPTSSPAFSFDGSLSSASTTAYNSAISAWNNANANVSLSTTNGSSDYTIGETNESGASWDGITYYQVDNGSSYPNYLNIQLNTHYTKNYNAATKEEVAAHEFGHALGLNHVNDCHALMNPSTPDRSNCGSYTPQADDIDGVRSLYGSNSLDSSVSQQQPAASQGLHLSWAQSYHDLGSLYKAADAVVVADVNGKSESTKDGIPFTDHRLTVKRWLKGKAATPLITVHEAGGTANGALVEDDDAPLLQEGQAGIYFLHQYAPGKFYIIGGADGRFDLSADGKSLAALGSSDIKNAATSFSSFLAQTAALSK